MSALATSFQMKIVQIFKFGPGRTVFVGSVEGHDSRIGSSTWELLVNGVRHQILAIEGEMIPEPRHELGYRSISSRNKINLENRDVENRECIVRGIKTGAGLTEGERLHPRTEKVAFNL